MQDLSYNFITIILYWIDYLTSASELWSTAATITGASPRTLNPKPSPSGPLWSCINRGAVQWRLAENIATGPNDLKRSSTPCCPKSGWVILSWNFVEATFANRKEQNKKYAFWYYDLFSSKWKRQKLIMFWLINLFTKRRTDNIRWIQKFSKIIFITKSIIAFKRCFLSFLQNLR